MKKKGFGMSELVVGVVLTIVIFFLYTQLAGEISKSGLRTACWESIFLEHAGSKYDIDVTTKQTTFNINCPRFKVSFEDRKTVFSDVRTSEEFKEKVAKTEEDYYRILAEEMRGCWWQFHEGKFDVFDKLKVVGTGTTKNSCFICSEIFFEKKIPPLSLTGLNRYMKETKLKNSPTTYWKFLSSELDIKLSTIPYEQFIQSIDDFTFNQSKRYNVVFFKTAKEAKWNVHFWGKDDTIMATVILPSYEVRNYCDEYIT